MDFGLFDLFSPALVLQSCTKGKGDDRARGKGIDAMAFHAVLYEDGDGRGQLIEVLPAHKNKKL